MIVQGHGGWDIAAKSGYGHAFFCITCDANLLRARMAGPLKNRIFVQRRSKHAQLFHVRRRALTYGIGIMATAMKANSVFAQWYVRRAYICCVKSGKAMPIRLPARPRMRDPRIKADRRYHVRKRLWPARADDANGP